MRGLWRALAYLAEDPSQFGGQLAAVAGQVTKNNLSSNVPLGNPASLGALNLVQQPSAIALSNIDRLLRPFGLILTAYELAELNRVAVDGRSLSPPFNDLAAYWKGMGEAATANRDHYDFMEATGALLIDWATRAQFVQGRSLTGWFPSVTPAQESALRQVLAPGTPADAAAVVFAKRSWPGGGCAAIVTMGSESEWIHLNT